MKNSKAIWTVKTECGPIREKNEDAIYPDKSGSSSLPIKAGIFDGMGGHKKGEVASLIASEVMNDSFIDIADYVNLANKNILDYQNVLTQALGSKEKLKIQTKDFQLKSGDVVFLCTDGVYNEIGDEYLKNKLMDGVTAESLISEVLLQNPKDNISAIIINVI